MLWFGVLHSKMLLAEEMRAMALLGEPASALHEALAKALKAAVEAGALQKVTQPTTAATAHNISFWSCTGRFTLNISNLVRTYCKGFRTSISLPYSPNHPP